MTSNDTVSVEPIYSVGRAPPDYRPPLPTALFRRFDRKEWAENFFKMGEVRFRSLGYYRRLEEQGSVRGDLNEGAIFRNLPAGTKMQIKDPKTGQWGHTLTFTNGRMNHTLDHHEKFFVSCYSKSNRDHHRKFGKYVVKIHDVGQFVSAIQSGFPNSDALFWGSIRYFDPDAPGPLIVNDKDLWLSKPNSFADEDEFRLVFFINGHQEGYASRALAKIELGSLETIAELIEVDEVDSPQSGGDRCTM